MNKDAAVLLMITAIVLAAVLTVQSSEPEQGTQTDRTDVRPATSEK